MIFQFACWCFLYVYHRVIGYKGAYPSIISQPRNLQLVEDYAGYKLIGGFPIASDLWARVGTDIWAQVRLLLWSLEHWLIESTTQVSHIFFGGRIGFYWNWSLLNVIVHGSLHVITNNYSANIQTIQMSACFIFENGDPDGTMPGSILIQVSGLHRSSLMAFLARVFISRMDQHFLPLSLYKLHNSIYILHIYMYIYNI